MIKVNVEVDYRSWHIKVQNPKKYFNKKLKKITNIVKFFKKKKYNFYYFINKFFKHEKVK